ncbi:MAG: hypothetical protein V3U82_06280 [Robiginitomaculum sp.]
MMVPLIGILTSIAMLIFWVGRAAKGAGHVVDAVEGIANLPRKLRYQKQAGRSGLDLVEDAREAAAVLMVSVARLCKERRVNDATQKAIEDLLVENMAWPKADAEEFILNIRWLTRDLKQPISTLRPMTNLLRKSVSGKEADDLAHMLTEVAICGGMASADQTQFIYKYRELMGLNARG